MPAATKTLINSFVASRIDYCITLFAGLPASSRDHVQSVLKAAARIIYGLGSRDHISTIMRDELHWLPVPQRVQYKLCLTAYNALHGSAPSYIADLCVSLVTVEGQRSLRSATSGHLIVPKTRTDLGKRAFAVAGPTAWNRLPSTITSVSNINSFKLHLKEHLLKLPY
jgi:hypothetical protein